MADLNLADPRRLANEFFTVRAGEAETAALGLELEADDGAALQFLGLARAAREGAPAAGLDAEAEASVVRGMEALIASRARKPGLFNRLMRLFRRGSRSPQPPAAKAAPAFQSPVSLPALRPPALTRPVPGRTEADMEDTAPIAEAPEPGSASPASPAPAGPPSLPLQRLPPPVVPAASAADGPRASSSPKPAGSSSRRAGLLAGFLAAGLLALGLYFQGPALMTRAPWGPWIASSRAALASRIPGTWAPWLAPPRTAALPFRRPPPMAPRPAPTPALALREDAASQPQAAPLPVELPQSTPVQAGVWN